jgi:hypothetical protein
MKSYPQRLIKTFFSLIFAPMLLHTRGVIVDEATYEVFFIIGSFIHSFIHIHYCVIACVMIFVILVIIMGSGYWKIGV